MRGKFLFYLFSFMAVLSLGYSIGAPLEACGRAKHDQTEQEVGAPYDIVLSATEIKGGDTVTVTVTGKTTTDTMREFLTQSRKISDGRIVGTFIIDENDRFVQGLDCFGIPTSSATNKSYGPVDSFNLTWSSPTDLKDEVVFYTTIVQDIKTSWYKLPSKILKVE